MTEITKPVAVVTGASSGIGEAAARSLAAAGFHVVLGARRTERLQAITAEIGARWMPLDVTLQASVDAFVGSLDQVAVLINNAGGALGLEPVAEADEDKWRTMYETNVLGTMRMTRALIPLLVSSGRGHIVNIGSVAGYDVYPGGAGYTAAKHAERAVTETLRLELIGKPVKVTDLAPGLVETEFSLVRFDGDAERAGGVYKGMTPLTAGDVADAITWVVTRPPHVNVDQLVIKPLDQASVTLVHRRP